MTMAAAVDALWISLALLVVALLGFVAATTVSRPVLEELRARRREVPAARPGSTDLWT
jgi:HAMP domain-containing protein